MMEKQVKILIRYNTVAMSAQNSNPSVTFRERCYTRPIDTDVASSVQIDAEMQHCRKRTNFFATNAKSTKASIVFHAKCERKTRKKDIASIVLATASLDPFLDPSTNTNIFAMSAQSAKANIIFHEKC